MCGCKCNEYVNLNEHKDGQDLDLTVFFSVATFAPQVLQHPLILTLVILFFHYSHWWHQYFIWVKITKFSHSAKFLTRTSDRIRTYVSNQFDLGTLIYLVDPKDLFITACPR